MDSTVKAEPVAFLFGIKIVRPIAQVGISVAPRSWRDVVAWVWCEIVLPALLLTGWLIGWMAAFHKAMAFK